MEEKLNTKRLYTQPFIWLVLITFVIAGAIKIVGNEQGAIAMELDRRPAIGYPVYRGEYTIMIMNMYLGEVYWFTNCPRLKDFTRYEEVAIYGDHHNRCHDWRTLTPSEHEISKK